MDGQQRLTSLYQSLHHLGPVDTSDSKRQKVMRWYYVNMLSAMDPLTDREDAIISVPENRKVTEDFGRQTVLDLSTPELEYQQHMIPTEKLMKPMLWTLGYLQYWRDADGPHPEGLGYPFLHEFSGPRRSKELRRVPVASYKPGQGYTERSGVHGLRESEHGRRNLLNVFELATASFAADADTFSLRDDWESRKRRMYSSFGVLQRTNGDQFLQAVALLKTQERRRLTDPEERVDCSGPRRRLQEKGHP